jgi:hypothetical protein
MWILEDVLHGLPPPQSLLKYLQITYMKFLNKSGERARCDGKIEMKPGRLCQIMHRSMVFEPNQLFDLF